MGQSAPIISGTGSDAIHSLVKHQGLDAKSPVFYPKKLEAGGEALEKLSLRQRAEIFLSPEVESPDAEMLRGLDSFYIANERRLPKNLKKQLQDRRQEWAASLNPQEGSGKKPNVRLQKFIAANLFGTAAISEKVFLEHPEFVKFVTGAHLQRWIPLFGHKLTVDVDGVPQLPVEIADSMQEGDDGWVRPQNGPTYEMKSWTDIKESYFVKGGEIYRKTGEAPAKKGQKPIPTGEKVIFTGLSGISRLHPSDWKKWTPIAQLSPEEVQRIQGKAKQYRDADHKNGKDGNWTCTSLSTWNPKNGSNNPFTKNFHDNVTVPTHPWMVMVSPEGLVYSAGFGFKKLGVRPAATVEGILRQADPWFCQDTGARMATYIPVNKDQAVAARNYVEEVQANPQNYNLLFQNCTVFAAKFLDKCGVKGVEEQCSIPLRKFAKVILPRRRVRIPALMVAFPVTLAALGVYGSWSMLKGVAKLILPKKAWTPCKKFGHGVQDFAWRPLGWNRGASQKSQGLEARKSPASSAPKEIY